MKHKRLTCDGCDKHVSPLKKVGGQWLCTACRETTPKEDAR